MKYLCCFLVLIIMFSCKEKENSVENILQNNLKGSSEYYENSSKELIVAYLIKNEEQSKSNVELKLIYTNFKKVKNTLNKLKDQNKEFQINEFEKIINQINLNSKNKFKNLDIKTLENLSNETSYYFIKNEFYKNFRQIILEYSRKNFPVIYCGATRYDEEEKYVLMDKLKRMKVQEFKDSICSSNKNM